MATASRDRAYSRLAEELQTSDYQSLLVILQRRAPLLRAFNSWLEVIGFMRAGSSRDPYKDEILRPIFARHAEDQDPRWRTILTVIFWPGLKSIHAKKRRWDPDPDELWQALLWIFLKVICRIDVRRRPDRLVLKVYCDTLHNLHDEYQRIWRRAKCEIQPEPDAMEAVADLRGLDFEEIDRCWMQERQTTRLEAHLQAGLISEADFLLILGTRVYGRTIDEYAREVGLSTEAAKKRRQRAEAAILKEEKSFQ